MTKVIETTFAIVIGSPKNIEENTTPNAADVEKINSVLIAPINLRAIMKRNAAMPVPIMANNTMLGT